MKMIQTLKNISKTVDGGHAINGFTFKIMHECKNDYHTDQLPTIPAGTIMEGDFAGDFGAYGIVEVDGALHKVKIDITELHKIDWGEFDARNV